MARRPQTLRPQGADYEIRVVGESPRPLRDFYHGLIRLSWTETIAFLAVAFLLVNALFAVGYVETGGIAHAAEGSFADAFFFSVQTMGTIGYGAMYPETRAANLLVVTESLVSIILTALATGLIFAKFSRPTARVVFTKRAVVCRHAGVPTLMFRIGNERGNSIVDAHIQVVFSRTEILPEGGTFYRLLDLKLTRDHALSLSRAWTVLHVIDETSPLFGHTPETITRDAVELSVLVVGLDDALVQTIHSSHQYYARDIVFGARMVDILTEQADGSLVLDLAKFDEIATTDSPG